MAIILVHYCPKNHPLKKSDRFLEGQIVFRCETCNLYRLEQDTQFVTGRTNDEVRANLKGVLEARERYQEMLESDINDPRWERIA